MRSALWKVLILVHSCLALNNNFIPLQKHLLIKLPSANLDVKSQNVLRDLHLQGTIDILSDTHKDDSLVRVQPENVDEVKSLLKTHQIQYKVEVSDLASYLQELEDEETKFPEKRSTESCTKIGCPKPFFHSYMTLDQIYFYLQNLREAINSSVTVEEIGRSVWNKPLTMVTIKSSNTSLNSGNAKKSIWIEGGIHAREWISPAVSMHIIENLLSSPELTDNFDFYIVPMSNPDGYAYSWSTDRMWRKNRASNNGHSCKGVDLNRNWDFKWGVGASSSACSEVYKGPSPFSESETDALQKAMKKVPNLDVVIAIHSYGQTMLFPWGWTAADAIDKAEMEAKAHVFINAAKSVNGAHYTTGSSSLGLYFASGATDDWAKQALGATYVYTLELRDNGAKGFLLPQNLILPTVTEVWAGLKAAFLSM